MCKCGGFSSYFIIVQIIFSGPLGSVSTFWAISNNQYCFRIMGVGSVALTATLYYYIKCNTLLLMRMKDSIKPSLVYSYLVRFHCFQMISFTELIYSGDRT